MVSSAYAVTAAYYDAVASLQRSALDAQLLAALAGLEAKDLPVLDIGAGTGLSTALIAKALPGVEILAVEPEPAMRAALMARVCSAPDLRSRVTILPMPLHAAPLPPVLSAAIGSACLVHFDPQERRELWELLRGRLVPGGRALFEVQCPVAQDLPDACLGSVEVGRVRYEAWVATRRLDEQRVRFRLRYLSRLDGALIAEEAAEHVCWAASADAIVAEAARTGLVGDARGDLVVLSPAR